MFFSNINKITQIALISIFFNSSAFGLQEQKTTTPKVSPKPSVIGIMGGMGPDATVDAQVKLLDVYKQNGAKKDQDYPNIIVSIASQTPDRTAHLVNPENQDPVPAMVRSLQSLERAGAGTIFITCNTAHAFYDEVYAHKHPETNLVSMIKETAKSLESYDPEKILLLATDGTLKTGVYTKRLGDKIMHPEIGSDTQNLVMDIIYGEHGIKAGYTATDARLEKDQTPWAKMQKILKEFPTAEKVVLGCTELPLAIGEKSDKFVDPVTLVINKVIEHSGTLATATK